MNDALDACPVPIAASVAALRAEGAALGPIVSSIGVDEWTRPTRLDAWNVRELAAHLLRGVNRIHTYLRAPVPPEPTMSWLDYWRRSREDADPVGIANRSIEEARELDVVAFPALWQEAWRSAAVEVEAEDPGRVLPPPFGAMRLDHYLPSRIVEVVVHGLDLRHALGLEEVATPQGLEVAAAACDGLLGVPRPVRLERDDIAFLLAATGRVEVDDPDLPVFT